MSVFDRERRNSVRGCPICGSRSAVRLNVVLQKLVANGKTGKSIGRAVSLCDEHGEALFLRIEDEIEATRAGRS